MKKITKLLMIAISAMAMCLPVVACTNTNNTHEVIIENETVSFDVSCELADLLGDNSILNPPDIGQCNCMLESGALYNINYKLIELYMEHNELRRFIRDSHPVMTLIAINGMMRKTTGEKDPTLNNPLIIEILDEAFRVGYKKFYLGLQQFWVFTVLNNFRPHKLFIYTDTYILMFYEAVKMAIDSKKESPDCPEEIKRFENYELDFSEFREESSTSVGLTPYYWIIIAGVGAAIVTAGIFVIVLQVKRKKQK